MRKTPLALLLAGLGIAATPAVTLAADTGFDLKASFLVCENTTCGDETSGDETETSSEILAASADGMTLFYSDSPGETVGLIDIADPANPVGLGAIDIGGSFGEPTSVAAYQAPDATEYMLAAVNTSPSFDAEFNADHAGILLVYGLEACKSALAQGQSCTPVANLDLGGQPDSVGVSPDGKFIVVAIENERDEEACHDTDGVLQPGPDGSYYGEDNEDNCENAGFVFGRLPQPNPGFLAVIAEAGASAPADWVIESLPLEGLAGLRFPDDPEPEFVDINSDNELVVSLQENNALVVVDLDAWLADSSDPAAVTSFTRRLRRPAEY